ncbi:MAG: Superfamily II helicase [Candidatus Accumulibacter sp. SK-11]|nr:MAG: Superfamily II helicase [Candidatus Accumulibacter sp. SK-11]HAY28480.1 hypothetical protein [Accumulibacter sp.]
MTNFAELAAPLVAHGYPVFPLKPDKRPHVAGGFKSATTDAKQIAAWAAQWPAALVGVPTGKASGLFVLDVDVKNGKDGFSTLQAKGWSLPATRTHRTKKGGGVHYLFRAPDGLPLKSSTSRLGGGLDTRGDGGYIVWWPAHGGEVEHADIVADVPPCLVDALQAPAPRKPAPAADAKDGEGITEGGRNDTLFRLAASLRGKGLTVDAIEAALQIENDAKCCPPLSADEVRIIAKSTGRYSEGATAGERCAYGNGEFEVSPGGVAFIGTDKYGERLPALWICSALQVRAMTRDAKSGEWGRLLEWRDKDNVRHQWAMPLELLQGDGVDVRRELARMGLTISTDKRGRDLLASFLQVWPVEKRARCVERLGWHGDVFVTPDGPIGQDGGLVVFQNAHAVEPAYSVAGTIDEWRDSVGRLAVGNSRLVFALSVAFAGALADVVGEDSGGFHFRGASSSGKTTALKVAASVWGDPSAYPRLWRATANGLEGLATLHNDGLLILDELSQIDPKEAGEAAYLLANGQGKARASRTGAARQSARWRLLFLSAGEESLTALMARAGRKVNAGQEIRLADLDADAGAGMGAFEALHDQPTAAALALALKDAATRYHGAVGLAWLRCIVPDRAELADFIAAGIKRFVADVAPKDAAGQVLRVARRFGLVAMAGELASGCDLVGPGYGLTGWDEGEATTAAQKCFAAWLEGFGGIGNREERALLGQVRAFFEAHGASRFAVLDDTFPNDRPIVNRAGFVRMTADGGREFLVLPEAFRREVCAGFDAKAATRALIEAGWIEPGGDGRATHKPRIPGIGTTECGQRI